MFKYCAIFTVMFFMQINISYASRILDAYMENDVIAFKKAIESGENINAKNKHGNTALMLAAYHGKTAFLELLLKAGADTELYRDKFDRRRALHLAAQSGAYRAFFMLLEHGANIKAEDFSGNTVLITAIEHNRVAILRQLFKSKHGHNILNGEDGEKIYTKAFKNKEIIKILAPGLVKIYSPSALKGNLNSIYFCIRVLEASENYEEIYKYIKTFEDEKFLKQYNNSHLSTMEHATLVKIKELILLFHLTGIGVKQDYAFAYKKFLEYSNIYKSYLVEKGEIAHTISNGYVTIKVLEEHFKNPNSPESAYVLWAVARPLIKSKGLIPYAEHFLVRATLSGGRYSNFARGELYERDEFLSLNEKRAFYGKYHEKLNAFAYEWALLSFDEHTFSKENIETVRKILQKDPSDPRAVTLLHALPTSTSDTEKFLALNEEFNKYPKMLIPRPLWLAISITNKVDAGILDKPLEPLEIYKISAKEEEMIKKYKENKQNFINTSFNSNSDPLLKNMKALHFLIFKDYEDKVVENVYTYQLNIDDYPPYEHHKTKELFKTLENEKNRYKKNSDYKSAIFSLKQVASKGYLPAMVDYGYRIAFDREHRNAVEGFEYILEAARRGSAEGMYRLVLLPNNGGDRKARDKDILQRAAKLGHTQAIADLKTQFDIVVAIPQNKKLADMLKRNNMSSLCGEARKMIEQGKSYEDVFTAASILWHIATHENGLQLVASEILGTLFYAGKIFPQDMKQAYSFLNFTFHNSPPRWRGNCALVSPLIEMNALALGTKQNLLFARRLAQEYGHCNGPWKEELAKKAIPIMKQSFAPHKNYPLRYHPKFEGWKESNVKLNNDDIAKIKKNAQNTNSLLDFLSTPLTAAPKVSSAEKGKFIKEIRILVESDRVILRFDSEEPLKFKAVPLSSPSRLVLEFSDTWKFQLPSIPKNAFVHNVRSGYHKGTTRFVIDFTKAPNSIRYIKHGATGLDVLFR